MRAIIGNPGAHEVGPSAVMFIANEAAEGYHNAAIYDAWDKEIEGLIGELVTRITELKKSGAGSKYIISIPALMIIQTRNTSE